MTSQNIWDDLWGSPEKSEVPVKSSYNSNELAQYFQAGLHAATWYSGFALVNLRALAGALAKWKATADPDTVRAMIDRYMTDEGFRGNNPGWQDFLYNAERIASAVIKTDSVQQKDKWDLMEEEWERKYGD